MLHALQCLAPSRLPTSTSSQYYFYPKLITLRPVNFNSDILGNRIVSKLEFTTLRIKMLEAGELPLKHTRRLYYSTLLYLFVCFLFWLVRLILNFALSNAKIKKTELIIAILMTIIPLFFLISILRKCVEKTYQYIQCLLEKENTLNFAHRGLHWKLSQNLKYIELTFTRKNDSMNMFMAELSTMRSPQLSTPRLKLTIKTSMGSSNRVKTYLDGNP